MGTPLHLLIIEDSDNDLQLILRELKKGGYIPDYTHIQTAKSLRNALKENSWDICISDYSLPRFNGLEAMKIIHESGKDIPFILISSTIGEEEAVKILKTGARDFILKENLSRLIPVIRRELVEKKVREDKKTAELSLIQREEEYRLLFENNLTPMLIFNPTTQRFLAANEAAEHFYGYSRKEIMNLIPRELWQPADFPSLDNFLSKIKSKSKLQPPKTKALWKQKNKVGKIFTVEAGWNPIMYSNMDAILISINDITTILKTEQVQKEFATLGQKLQSVFTSRAAEKIIFDTADSLMGWDVCFIDPIIEKEDHAETIAIIDTVNGKREEFIFEPVEISPMKKLVLKKGAQLILRSPDSKSTESKTFLVGNIHRKSASLMYAPIRKEGKIRGIFSIQSYTYNAYTRDDLYTFQALADYCSETLDRIQKDNKLRESEERYRAFISQSTEGIWRFEFSPPVSIKLPVDKQIEHFFEYGYLAECNDAMARMYGFDNAKQIIGIRLKDIMIPTDSANIQFHKDFILSGYQLSDRISHEINAHGKHKYFLNNLMGLLENDMLIRTWGTQQDVTDKKYNEMVTEIISSLGYKLSEVTKPEQAAEIIADAAGKILGCDAFFLDIYYPDINSVSNILHIDTINGKKQKVLLTNQKYVPIKQGSILTQTIEQGPQLILRDNIKPISNMTPFGNINKPSASLMFVPVRKGEKVIGILSIQSYTLNAYSREDLKTLESLAHYCSSALERIQAETARSESEDKYRYLVENINDGITISHIGRFVYANKKFADMLGYTLEEIQHKDFRKIYSPEGVQQLLDKWKLIEHHLPVPMHYETTLLKKDGTQIPVEINASHTLYQDEPAILGVIRDISIRKQSEELREAFINLGVGLNTATTHKEAARVIADVAQKLLGWDACVIARYNPETDLAFSILSMDTIGGNKTEVPANYAGNKPSPMFAKTIREGPQLILRKNPTQPLSNTIPFGNSKQFSASLIYSPIRKGPKIVGFITIQSYLQDYYSEHSLQTLQALADHCGGALERIQAETSLIESELKHRMLVENVNDGIVISQGERFVFINPRFADMLGYPQEELLTKGFKDIYTKEGIEFILHRGKLRDQGLVVPNRYETTFLKKDQSLLVVEVNVTIMDYNGKPATLGVIRDITERKHSEQRIESQLHRLAALRSIDMAITASVDIRVTINVLLDQVISQLSVDAASILYLNQQTQTLEFIGGRGFRTAVLQHTHLRIGEGHAGKAAFERKIVNIPNLLNGAGDLSRAPLLSEEKFVCYYGVPLLAKGHVLGVLELFNRTPLDPDPEWLDFLETLAGQAAIAMDNSSLFTNLQKSNVELSIAYDATIEGWSKALDLRDKETEGHTQRVTQMTLKLARTVGINDIEMVHIRRGALLHDIGKMGIPDGILLKPGSLTDEEWVIMRLHPVYAYNMLSTIDYLRPALDIPYCHHEKWDGSGYPRGLRGETIPLSARIFAIIDVWDALSSNRPYRPAWTKEKVLDYIRSNSGIHFDPNIVEIFLGLEEI